VVNVELDNEKVKHSLKEVFEENKELTYFLIGFLSACVKNQEDIDKIIRGI